MLWGITTRLVKSVMPCKQVLSKKVIMQLQTCCAVFRCFGGCCMQQ